MFERMAALALAAGLALTGIVASSNPSYAASGQVSASNGVLYDGCVDKSYSYSVAPDYYGWNLDVDLYGPDGTLSDSDFLYSGSDPATGSSSFLFCGYEDPGTFTIKAVLTAYGYDYVATTTTLPSAGFSMRRPHSRTALTASTTHPRFNGRVVLVAHVREERPNGDSGADYATVRLQYLSTSGWKGVRDGELTTDSHGAARIAYRWNVRGTVKLRARTLPGHSDGSTSKVLKVTTRSGRTVLGLRGTPPLIP